MMIDKEKVALVQIAIAVTSSGILLKVGLDRNGQAYTYGHQGGWIPMKMDLLPALKP